MMVNRVTWRQIKRVLSFIIASGYEACVLSSCSQLLNLQTNLPHFPLTHQPIVPPTHAATAIVVVYPVVSLQSTGRRRCRVSVPVGCWRSLRYHRGQSVEKEIVFVKSSCVKYL